MRLVHQNHPDDRMDPDQLVVNKKTSLSLYPETKSYLEEGAEGHSQQRGQVQLLGTTTEGPSWGYPVLVLGAVSSLLREIIAKS